MTTMNSLKLAETKWSGMQFLNKLKQLYLPKSISVPPRRYDLDWLRVLAFALLILYHIGMLYVANWGYYVKSQYLNSGLENVMLLVNPWRMLLLWFVSGVAVRFVLAKVSLSGFVAMRSIRLLLPLLFGILVIVPPQLYYEMTYNGDLSMSYWQFYSVFFDFHNPLFKNYQPGIWPHIDVNHLWYLRELWRFSLYLVVLLPILNSGVVEKSVDWLVRQHAIVAIGIPLVPVFAIQVLVKDTQNPLGFLFLLYGYVFAWQPIIWQRVRDNTRWLLFCAVVCYLLILVLYNLFWTQPVREPDEWILLIGGLILSLDRVVWLLALIGLANRYLNHDSSKLAYFNEAVYPYYILHQTIIVAAGFELARFSLGPVLEPLLVAVITFSCCAIGFEVIRRIEFLRPFFGLKLRRSYRRGWRIAAYTMVALMLVPFGLEILV